MRAAYLGTEKIGLCDFKKLENPGSEKKFRFPALGVLRVQGAAEFQNAWMQHDA